MSASIDRPSLFTRLALPGAFVVALGCLIAQAFAPFELASDVTLGGLAAGPLALLTMVLASFWLSLSSMRDPERAPRLRLEAMLTPCVLAPLAVLSPWTIAPTHFGPSYASFPFFLAWLTRYPTLGPVNHEVLLGIGALLGACAMPVVLAAYVASTGRPRARVVVTLAILQLVAYLPVLLRLDMDLLGYAAHVSHEGQLTIAGPIVGACWQNALSALMIGAGALLRAAATAVMLAFVPLSLRAKRPLVVWETE